MSGRKDISERHLEVSIRQGLTSVNPPINGLFSYFRRREIVYTSEGDRGYHASIKTINMFGLDSRGRLVIPTGLADLAIRELSAQGYRPVVVDVRAFDHRHEPDMSYAEALDFEDRRIADALIKHPIGAIQVGGPKDQLACLTLICKLFGFAKIAVVVSTKLKARMFWDGLCGELPESVGLVCHGKRDRYGRVTVLTYKSLTCLERGQTQVFVYIDTIDATGEIPREIIGRISYRDPSRIYGIIRGSMPDHPTDAMLVEALVGPVIHSSLNSFRPVYLQCVDSYSQPMCEQLAGLARKRIGYWSNKLRNQRIIDVAMAMASGDIKTLWSLGLFLHHDERLFALGPPAVAILVESNEHGRQLLRHLHGWTSFKPEDPHGSAKIIVSVTSGARVDLPGGVLLVASGGDCLPAMELLKPRTRYNVDDPILLVDFMDDFDSRAKDETAERLRRYQSMNWTSRLPAFQDQTTPGAAPALASVPTQETAETPMPALEPSAPPTPAGPAAHSSAGRGLADQPGCMSRSILPTDGGHRGKGNAASKMDAVGSFVGKSSAGTAISGGSEPATEPFSSSDAQSRAERSIP